MVGRRSHDSQPTIVSAHHYSHVDRRDFNVRGDVNGTTSRVSNRPSASDPWCPQREAWGPKDYPEAPVEPENPRPRSTPTNRIRAANRGGPRRSAAGAYTGLVRLDARTWHRPRQAPPGQLLKVATDRPYPQPNRSTCFVPRPFSSIQDSQPTGQGCLLCTEPSKFPSAPLTFDILPRPQMPRSTGHQYHQTHERGITPESHCFADEGGG